MGRKGCAPLGSHTQSTISSAKALYQERTTPTTGRSAIMKPPLWKLPRHSAACATPAPTIERGSCSTRVQSPRKREGIHARRPSAPMKRETRAHWLFALDAKRSAICRPQRFSSYYKSSLHIIQSSGMSFDSSSAKEFSSRGTHTTIITIRCSRQNQKS